MKIVYYTLWRVDPTDPRAIWFEVGRAQATSENEALERIIESGIYINPSEEYIFTISI